MTSISVLITLLAVCVATAMSCSCKKPNVDEKDLKKLALANNELAFNLNRWLISDSSENVVFSPFSISVVFAMLFYGARGDTAQELRKALGYDQADLSSDLVPQSFHFFLNDVLKSGDSSNQYILDVANAILVDKHLELKKDFKNAVEDFFEAKFSKVNFLTGAAEVVKEINSWVEKKTHGKIQKFLDQLDPSTVMVLLNAVYFKGTWETQFNTALTREECFYNYGSESEETEVETMHLTAKFPYASVDNFQALELPYKGDNISMIILLPNELDGLRDLENSLTPKKLADIQKKMYKKMVEVSLPKFKLQFEKELSSEVKSLGANQIFCPGSADFSGMTSSKEVYVSQIIHKAVIEVNEKGSEAAAATGIVVTKSQAVPVIPVFKADHPFLFAILEKSINVILFLGSVNIL